MVDVINQDEFSDWLEEHHTEASELWVGFYKKNTERASLTCPEAVEMILP